MERFIERSKKFVVDCRKRYSCKDSRLDDLDKVFTSFLRTPLHIAATDGDTRFAKEIISSSIDPNLNLSSKQDSNGFTPLHLASARTSLQMVKLLLKANPDACTVQSYKDGKTPLHLASMKDRVDIMQLLMEERPEAIHLKNYHNGETILHFCVKSSSSLRTFKLLVDKLVLEQSLDPDAISINSKDNDGNTVLHLAVEMGRIEIRNYLLKSKNIIIDLDAVNNNGKTALDILSQSERDHLEIGLYDYFGHAKELTDETLSEQKDHHKQVMNKNSPKSRSHEERVNALLVVATLVAGIAFQAMLNPPGGVWQEDSRIDSDKDPVKFGYYLNHMFDSSVSGSLDRYTQDNLLLNDSTSNTSTTTEWKGYSEAQENVYNFMSILRDYSSQYSTWKGLILEDYTDATVSAYNSSDGGGNFFPYLIRYAGFPIMAYTNPDFYVNYMLANTIAFSLSLTVVFAVICGFVQDKSVAQNRILVLLMCISIGCISTSFSYVLLTLTPTFFIKNQAGFSVCIYFGLCCICGIGLFLWRLISKMIELQKKHLTVFNYFKALFTMDASAAGKVALLIVGLYAFHGTFEYTKAVQ